MIHKNLKITIYSCVLLFVFVSIIYHFFTIIDTEILIAISKLRTDFLTELMIWISNIGSFSVYIWLIGIVCIWYILHRRYSTAVIVIFNILFSMFLNDILKGIFQRPRPDIRMMDVSGFSFPSGHTMNNTAIYGFLIFLVLNSSMNKCLKFILIIFMSFLTGMIGFSRMYLAVHYPTDIIGGLCGGIFVVSISILLFQKYCNEKPKSA